MLKEFHSLTIGREAGGRVEIHHTDGSVTYCDGPIVVVPVIYNHLSQERLEREAPGYQLNVSVNSIYRPGN